MGDTLRAMRSSYTIAQDTREKLPLIFPENLIVLDPTAPPSEKRCHTVKLTVIPQKLDTADYLCVEAPDACVIERKGSLDEMYANVTKPDRYASLEGHITRMSKECAYPYLLMQGDPVILCRPSQLSPEPAVAHDAFMRLLLRHKVGLLLLLHDTVPRRRAMGEWAARLLVNGALLHEHLAS